MGGGGGWVGGGGGGGGGGSTRDGDRTHNGSLAFMKINYDEIEIIKLSIDSECAPTTLVVPPTLKLVIYLVYCLFLLYMIK